jgi:mannose-6-phosphate isomerase-like protein (cupin superfamily)
MEVIMAINKAGHIYQRPWGGYKVLALEKGYQVKSITVNPHQRLSLQKHLKRQEHWIVVQGEFRVQVADKTHIVQEGDVIHIPIDTVHRMANETDQPAVLIEVQMGSYLGEDDIIRLEDDYGR